MITESRCLTCTFLSQAKSFGALAANGNIAERRSGSRPRYTRFAMQSFTRARASLMFSVLLA